MFGNGPAILRRPRIVVESGAEKPIARGRDRGRSGSNYAETKHRGDESYIVETRGNCLPGIPEGTLVSVSPYDVLEPLCFCVFSLTGDPVARGKLFLGHSEWIRVGDRFFHDVVLMAQIEPLTMHFIRRTSLSALHRAELPAETGAQLTDAMVGLAIGGYLGKNGISPINSEWRPAE